MITIVIQDSSVIEIEENASQTELMIAGICSKALSKCVRKKVSDE